MKILYSSNKIMGKSVIQTSVFLILFLIYGWNNHAHAQTDEPVGLILTWQQDPTTTMTVDWHTQPGDEANPTIYYKPSGDTEWTEATATQYEFPHSDRTIHRVELTALIPGTSYSFRVGEFERPYSFNTMPAELDRPIRFATGGNVMHNKEWMAEMNTQVMAHEPDFIVWGGDLAYAMGLEENVQQWHDFFSVMMETLISEEGKAMPVIVAIGDHETKNQYIYKADDYVATNEWRAENAPYFFALWAFPGQPGYNVLDFGDYLSLFVLDSMHANDTEGDQETWLNNELAERQHVPHVFPFYHVGGWASVKGVENGPEQKAVYDNFYPAFEEYGVRVAFENHDYAYKRTPPMKGGAATNPGDGVVYLGDGAWGVQTFDHIRFLDESRIRPKSERFGHIEVRADGIMNSISDIWYLDEFKSERHFTLATIFEDKQHFMVINEEGNAIDEYTEDDYDPYYVREPEPHTGRWITNLLVYEGTDWAVDASLEAGKRPYVDGLATLDTIPDAYQGLEWIRTATDAAGRNQDLASLVAPSDGILYIAIDGRFAPPAWMEDWIPAGDDLAIDDDGQTRNMNIYKLNVERDEVIGLGPLNNTSASMYIVFSDYSPNFISGLEVNDGQKWRKVTSFGEGRPIFVDEATVASIVPEAYHGLEWIQTANSSRLSPESPLASFRMIYDGDVYLAVNSLLASNPPAWLDDWQATGDEIRAGFVFNVFKRDYKANDIVELGPQMATRGTHYFVLIDSDQLATNVKTEDRPAEFALHSNYPNPFNSSTVLLFELPEDGHTSLNVYDQLGRLVATIVNESLTTGSHSYTFNASGLSSGLYFYRLNSGSFSQVRSMMLIK